jgi:hypothetical protein
VNRTPRSWGTESNPQQLTSRMPGVAGGASSKRSRIAGTNPGSPVMSQYSVPASTQASTTGSPWWA